MRRLTILMLLVASVPAFATNYYVDGSLASASCTGTSYSIANRNCTGSDGYANKTLEGFRGAITPAAGDTVNIRAGTYTQQLIMLTSGTAGNPITYSNYNGESVTLSGTPTNTFFNTGCALTACSDGQTLVGSGISYVTVQGLTVGISRGNGFCNNCQHVVVQNITFSQHCTTYHGCTAPTIQGYEASLAFYLGGNNKVLNNSFSGAFDTLMFFESDHNLISGNTATSAAHGDFNISCSNYNLITGNTYANTVEKIGEVFDCESYGITLLNATQHNFIEHNTFTATPTPTVGGGTSTGDFVTNGIQWCGQYGVVRQNVFYTNIGGGLHIQVYADECTNVYGNRGYQNSFNDNQCWGALSPNNDTNAVYNEFKNNLFFHNAGGASQSDCVNTIDWGNQATTAQLIIRSPSTAHSTSNMLAISDPGWVNAAGRDYHLAAGSAAIDAGAWLTTANGAGTGSTSLIVVDATYFRDAMGIDGIQGDQIQLQGQIATAHVTAVNYTTNTLTLDTPLTWAGGAGVALAYSGTAPDAGAFEFTPSSFTLTTATAGTGSGTVTGCAGSYAAGAGFSCTVTPGAGSTLTSVSGCGGSGTTTFTGTMSADCTVTATFTAIISTIVLGGVSISGGVTIH